MRVLWFTNIPMPAMDRRMGKTTQGSGYWMISLLYELARISNISVAVVTAWAGTEDAHFIDDRIEYFIIGQPKGTSHLSFRECDLKKCMEIIGSWSPDIVHIHGTERFYGLITAETSVKVPIVISLQGLLGKILPYFFGNMHLLDVLSCHKLLQFVRGYGLLFDYLRLKKASVREAAIMKSAANFIGRTRWDHDQAMSANNAAKYYHVDETMRHIFFEREWQLAKAQRHRIIFTNARGPLKNVEILLDAVRLLADKYGDISLKLAGSIDMRSGYGKHLSQQISRLGLQERVAMLGYLDEDRMTDEMLKSHLFCNSSLVENSPNSLCEAQLLGMPCLGSYAGGIPTLISEGVTGLLFPTTGPAVLAETIDKVFSDNELAESLGKNARQIATERHDPGKIVEQLLSAYRGIVQYHSDGVCRGL